MKHKILDPKITLPALAISLALTACDTTTAPPDASRYPWLDKPDTTSHARQASSDTTSHTRLTTSLAIDTLGLPTASLPLSPATDSLVAQMLRDRRAELDYYLDRHNVQDEGYELVAAFAQGHRHHVDLDNIPIYNIGRWRGHRRQGTAVSRDSLGRITIGIWDADTLTAGIRIDIGTLSTSANNSTALRNSTAPNHGSPRTAALYIGDFCGGRTADQGRSARAEGHGALITPDGRYFEGHWVDDRREGFGLQLLENGVATVLSTGQWTQDRFMGERMNYTSERVYGIDISRYQHGKGRKKYPILWSRLRITHLGSKSRKRISGEVDYPVQFVFIKSTEGITVRNPYYAQDYQACRRAAIPIGAYHFFSTRRTGQAQAEYFLKHTRFQKGDLPPVLDIEPSRADIQRMGGSPALWRSIRDWLRIVERGCGVKPILYVNQRFVNEYLPDAPDVKAAYKVWIARYGEYKPDLKLAVWQLSPDGRVSGITGDVDINVFNGYQTQFEEFLDQETIK